MTETVASDRGFVLPSQCQDNPDEPCDVRCTSARHPATWCRVCRTRVEVIRLREKNKELNRRCQSAEAGLAVKLDEVKRQGGSFGRALAFAGYTKAEAENAELRAALAEAKAEIDALCHDLGRYQEITSDQAERIAKLERERDDWIRRFAEQNKQLDINCAALASPSEPAGRRKGE